MLRLRRGICAAITSISLLLAMESTAIAGRDVTLGPRGQLKGKVLSAEGQPVAYALVSVRSSRGAVVTRSNGNGAFSVSNVGAGAIEVRTPQGAHQIRAWTEGTAPPAADNAAFLREQRPGNRGGRGFEQRVLRSGRSFENHPSLNAPIGVVSP